MVPIEEGAFLLEADGLLVDHPSRHSIQVEESRHVDLPVAEGLAADPDRYPWGYMNHSCNPNAAFVGLRLIAIASIRQWHEITFDYNTTEYEMAAPFACECGRCEGNMIRGFRHLPANRQRELYPRIADHLRRRRRP